MLFNNGLQWLKGAAGPKSVGASARGPKRTNERDKQNGKDKQNGRKKNKKQTKEVDESLIGRYHSVQATALDLTMAGDDVYNIELELKKAGKATMTTEEDTANLTWTSDGSTITLKVEGTEIVGEIGKDILTFKSFLKETIGMDMDMVFAKKGTEADNPALYLPEEEKAILGNWVGASVVDALDEDASEEVAPDTLQANIKGDHTITASYEGEEIINAKWSLLGDTIVVDGDVKDDANFYAVVKDGALVIAYSRDLGDIYYSFTMANAEKSADHADGKEDSTAASKKEKDESKEESLSDSDAKDDESDSDEEDDEYEDDEDSSDSDD